MRVFSGGEWRDGFLDEHRPHGSYRIQPLIWVNLEELKDLYFVRPRSIRLVWNYLREIGVREVLRKIISRSNERHRNQKFVSCGVGRIIDADAGADFGVGDLVAFIAPLHPPCMERVVLSSVLVAVWNASRAPDLTDGVLRYHATSEAPRNNPWWGQVRGWSPFSGRLAEHVVPGDIAERVIDTFADLPTDNTHSLSLGTAAPVRERSVPVALTPATDRPRGVLLGYGNFAKTVVLPNIHPYIDVTCVHEVDPLQIPHADDPVAWDTSPVLRSDESYDAVLIAGYHHTHAPLAVEALRRGCYAVVEKPLVTDAEQLEELLSEVQKVTKLFGCFQRRYLPFNDLARADMELRPGEPVSYHAIVYEVPLPELHWYRWPNSQSRLVSNGCHWIDHFLFLNDYADVSSYDLVVARDGTVNCSAELENGAFFTMVLTDQGSERIGVQDHVELRARDVTVKMVNASEYVAESADRILRRKRINKMMTYRTMYRKIGQRVAAGLPGDSPKSLEVGSRLMLAFERRLHELLRPAASELAPTEPSLSGNGVDF